VVRPRAPPTKMPGFLQPLAVRDALGRSPLVFPSLPFLFFSFNFPRKCKCGFYLRFG
jgi:hypothetical protein